MQKLKFGKIKHNLFLWALDKLLEESGVDLSPEPGVSGVISQAEEENVLFRLWQDKEWVALMRKYAEKENKSLVAKSQTDQEFWYFKAKFMCYNSMLLKARRAFVKVNGKQKHNNN